MSERKTCAWCYEAVENGAETCDNLCAKLLRLYRARRPVEPRMARRTEADPIHQGRQQYHGNGYRE